MPGYKAHVVFAIGVFAATMGVLSVYAHRPIVLTPAIAFLWFMSTILGALFPDVDIKSKGHMLFYEIIIFVLFFTWLKAERTFFIVITFLSLLPLLVRHRGLFHAWWFIISIPFFVALTFSCYYPLYCNKAVIVSLFFSLGALSHCFLDQLVTKLNKRR